MTNLDNLAALIALVLVVGAGRGVLAFAIAQSLVLIAAMATAMGVGMMPGWTGYLGVIPIGLGAYALWHQMRRPDQDDLPQMGRKSSVLATALLFLTMSTDSFAVLTPFLADAQPGYRIAGLVGAAFAAAGLAMLGFAGAHAAAALGSWTHRLERVAPIVMILAGLYVLANTTTDLI